MLCDEAEKLNSGQDLGQHDDALDHFPSRDGYPGSMGSVGEPEASRR